MRPGLPLLCLSRRGDTPVIVTLIHSRRGHVSILMSPRAPTYESAEYKPAKQSPRQVQHLRSVVAISAT